MNLLLYFICFADVFRRTDSVRSLSPREPSGITDAMRLAERRLNGTKSPESPRSISLQRESSYGMESETVEERRTRSLDRHNSSTVRQSAASQLEELERKWEVEERLGREAKYSWDVNRTSAERTRVGSEKRSFDDVQSDTALERNKLPYSKRTDSQMSAESDFSSDFVKANGDLTGKNKSKNQKIKQSIDRSNHG